MNLDTFLARAPEQVLAKAYTYFKQEAVRHTSDLGALKQEALVGISRPVVASLTFKENTIDIAAAGCGCRKGNARRPCAHILALAIDLYANAQAAADALHGENLGNDPVARYSDQPPPGKQEAGGAVAAQADLDLLYKFMATQSFDTQADVEAFMQGIEGKTVEEFIAGKPGGDWLTAPEQQVAALLTSAQNAESKEQRVKLINQAIALDPDNLRARIMKAGCVDDATERISILRRLLVEASVRFDNDTVGLPTGEAWRLPAARPYLELNYQLANEYLFEDYPHEAIELLVRLLELDSLDHLGARYLLAVAHTQLHEWKHCNMLWRTFYDEQAPSWLYTHAVAKFLELGDTPLARKLRARALSEYPAVWQFLLEKDTVPSESELAKDRQTAAWVVSAVSMEKIFDDAVMDWFGEGASS